MAVEHVDIESLLAKRPHGIEPFLLTRPTATHPKLDPVQLPVRFGFPKSVNNAAEGLFDVGKVCDGTSDDNILDARQRADLIGKHFYSPVRWIARILGIVRELASSSDNCIRIIDAGSA